MIEIAAIQKSARDIHDAKRRTRAASRVCPIELHRTENGMAVHRAVRDDAKAEVAA